MVIFMIIGVHRKNQIEATFEILGETVEQQAVALNRRS